MPNIKVVNMAGQEVGELELSAKVFGANVNEAVLHTAVRAFLMNQRQGTQSALTRSEVSGGGKKPWKQKGTGHARQGSTRSPQWTHGGIVFAPKPRSYRVELNKGLKRAAMFSALSSKVAGGEMIVVDAITANEYKTKAMVAMLEGMGADAVGLNCSEGPMTLAAVAEEFLAAALSKPAVLHGAKTLLTQLYKEGKSPADPAFDTKLGAYLLDVNRGS